MLRLSLTRTALLHDTRFCDRIFVHCMTQDLVAILAIPTWISDGILLLGCQINNQHAIWTVQAA